MASLQLTANFLAPRCLSTGRHEMSTSTATSHTPAEGHAHILTVHSSHWREGEQWTDHVPPLPATGCREDGGETNRRRSSGRQDAVEEGTRAHAHQQDFQGWRLVWGEGGTRGVTAPGGLHSRHSQNPLSPYHLYISTRVIEMTFDLLAVYPRGV